MSSSDMAGFPARPAVPLLGPDMAGFPAQPPARGPDMAGFLAQPEIVCTDGPVWTQGVINQNINWRVAAFGNGRLMAGGTNGAPLFCSYSDDYGATWTTGGTPVTTIAKGQIAYGNGVWLMGGNSIAVSRSVDGGVSWASVATASTNKSNFWYAGQNTFLSAGNSRADVSYSADGGFSWGVRPLPGSTSSGTTFGGTDGVGNHVVIGSGFLTTYRSSDNGGNWVFGGNLPAVFTPGCSVMASGGNGSFVALPLSTTIHRAAYTTDAGMTWNAATLPTPPATTQWGEIIYSQGRYLAVSTSTASGVCAVAQSADLGVTWTTPTNGITWPVASFNPIGGLAADGKGHYVIVPATVAVNTVIQLGLC